MIIIFFYGRTVYASIKALKSLIKYSAGILKYKGSRVKILQKAPFLDLFAPHLIEHIHSYADTIDNFKAKLICMQFQTIFVESAHYRREKTQSSQKIQIASTQKRTSI